MSLLQMSFSGAVMILTVIIIRALAINRLPKKTFMILWGIVLLRLLVPFSIPSALSVYSLAERGQDPLAQAAYTEQGIDNNSDPDDIHMNQKDRTNSTRMAISQGGGKEASDEGQTSRPVLKTDSDVIFGVIWMIGFAACALYFVVSYLRFWFRFQASFPVENAFVQRWLQEQSCQCPKPVLSDQLKWLGAHRRRPCVRQSDRVSTPLTYGVLHPVILMPKGTDWEDVRHLQYVLTHEYVHICRYDALTKLLVICALCVHWFNPMVWIMWLLFNRDVEISCDESVVRRMGESSRSSYALMLIRMEAARSGVAPLCSGLLSKIGKNAMEERITAIMKTKKKSALAVAAAAILVISVTTAFATSAAGNKNTDKKEKTVSIPDTDLTEQEYEMLLALKFDGYEKMSISAYRDKVWKETDTEQYNDVINRFFQDEAIYAKYETMKGTDSNETYDFLYNVLGPILSGRQSARFNGGAVTDFASASDNATLEYTGTLTILDADVLTVGEYISARHMIGKEMGNALRDLSVSELRDEERMKIYIDELILNITMTVSSDQMHVDIEYIYVPLNGVSVDEMGDSEKERRDEWEKLMAPYVPFGLTYEYDWDTDDYKMFFYGKEVRGIYDEEENVWISEHAGIGENIYAADAVELFVVYENHRIAGLREATVQEEAEITSRRQAVTDEYKNNAFQEIRRTTPATEEDYRSLFTLKTPDYRQRSIADFNMEFLDWCNENYERMDRIGDDRGWEDYRVALTDEERSFVELTTWFSGMENGEYVRSLKKSEPQQDICINIHLSGKEEYAQGGYGMAWCSLDCGFSYHIADREKVTIGERDGQIGKMVREIQDYWESSDIDEILQMTESDMLEWLQSIAAKYSSRNVTITILDDQTGFECMDERGI